MKILYVEDNPLDADLTRRNLARHAPDYQLDVVSTLSQARSCILNDPSYDLILLDLQLPDGSGLDLLSEVRAQALPIATVVMTGSGDEESAIAALKAGADDYLVKRQDYFLRLPQILETAFNQFHAEAARKARSMHVLYAEHNTADIDLTQRHLARHAPHIHIEAVHSAEEVLRRTPEVFPDRSSYDVLLVDYHLPGTNALELLKVLRQEHNLDLPIIMITGHGNEDIAIQAWRLGATDYLVKTTGYLFKLPVIIENAFHRVQLERERTALSNSEARYRRLTNNAPDIIFRYRLLPTSGFEYVNPAITTITGYTPEEHYNDRSLEAKMLHPDDGPFLNQQMTEGKNNRPVVRRWIRKDGEIIWVEQHTVPVHDDQGNLIALEGIARDITERRRAQIAEHEQRLFAEALANTARTLISVLDRDGVMNTILENVSHVVPHDAANIMLIEQDRARPVYWRGYRPELIPEVARFQISVSQTPNLREMYETGTPFLASHIDKYSNWVSGPLTAWVNSYVAAPIRSHGNVIGFLNLDSGIPGFYSERHAQHLQAFADQASIAIEQTQLYEEIRRYASDLEQRVEKRTTELNQTLKHIEAILNSSDDIIILCNIDGTIRRVNPAFEKTFNRESSGVLFHPLTEFVVADQVPLLETAFNDVISIAQSQRLEVTVCCGEQRATFDADVVLSPIVENTYSISGVVCSMRDITERMQMEAKLRQMLEHEMELSELKSRYVSMAAHDLRNPLAVILSAISTIHQYHDRLTQEQFQAKFDNIKVNIRVMVDMLDDILTIGQAESGKLTFNPAPLDVIAFCQEVAGEIDHTANATSRITLSSQGDCSVAYLDIKLLRHILGNLLSNAIKYSHDGGHVTFTVHCEPRQIIFRIQDQGIGIPANDQKRLFEAFHRASNAQQIPGTGLGLAIAKQSVELHGGIITFESEEAVGTTFTVVLPQIPAGNYHEKSPGH